MYTKRLLDRERGQSSFTLKSDEELDLPFFPLIQACSTHPLPLSLTLWQTIECWAKICSGGVRIYSADINRSFAIRDETRGGRSSFGTRMIKGLGVAGRTVFGGVQSLVARIVLYQRVGGHWYIKRSTTLLHYTSLFTITRFTVSFVSICPFSLPFYRNRTASVGPSTSFVWHLAGPQPFSLPARHWRLNSQSCAVDGSAVNNTRSQRT